MSLKQWHRRQPEEQDSFEITEKAPALRQVPKQDSGLIDSALSHDWQDPEENNENAIKAPQVDAAMWQSWEEKEGDEDQSGDIAMLCGDLDHDKNCIDNRKKFVPDPAEGWVMMKSSDSPAWVSAYGFNIGPSRSGHCVWEICVIMRMGNMYIGVVNPDGMRGELDRRWDSNCFRDNAFYWATTGGCLMNGPDIIKNLPTNKVPVCHFNYGDTITLDLKTNPARLRGRAVEVTAGDPDAADGGLSFITTVKVRLDEPLSAQHIRQGLPPVQEMPTLFFEGRIHRPARYVKKDMSFYLAMRRAPKVGEQLLFECAGELTLFHNGLRVGAIGGVPNSACPAVCMSGKGDMVRLQAPPSLRDQAAVNAVRDAVVAAAFAARSPDVRDFASDRALLHDWVLLKAVRWNRYDAAAAADMVREYCERRARGALREAEGRRQMLRELTEYAEDTTVSDRFAIAGAAGRWAPQSIEEALDWEEEAASEGSDRGSDSDIE